MTINSVSALKEKDACRLRLAELLASYDAKMSKQDKNRVSEETVRSWLSEFLGVFGWDVKDIRQVWQEVHLSSKAKTRLKEINSKHERPDYTLLGDSGILTFLDAKSLAVDVFSDVSSAFQIRSYGWSAQVPCAFVSNFEQLAIYDTRYVPKQGQSARDGVIQVSYGQYLEMFDLLFDRLWKGNVRSGKLAELYETDPSEGGRTLDARFVELLSAFRKRLAVGIYAENRNLVSDESALNYYVQVVLDRMIFIRVCESRGIETKERLREFQASRHGFWHAFRESCYMEFYRHYDGAMFERDKKFARMEIADDVFDEFIDSLYYPAPYRFDVIPVMLIAKIYEEFLGKRLVVENGIVSEVFKGEYVKTQGAVPTPEHLVRKVCHSTLPQSVPTSDAEMFGRKMLDPCCGSGVFLMACYEIAEKWFVSYLKADGRARRRHRELYVIDDDGNWILTIAGRRKLISECLFGIDIDESAIEVTKMSLALKIIDGNHVGQWSALGAYGDRILRDVSANIRLGNTLVPANAGLPDKLALSLKAFGPASAFDSVYANGRGGFPYIVCNPPYVETKFFKAADSSYHAYLSRNYEAFEGKADLAVLFIERCLQLVAEGGKIGLIVHRRWFRTEYGAGIRRLINRTSSLEKVVEFQDTSLFRGRTNYVAIITLTGRGDGKVVYERIPGDGPTEVDHPTGEAPWVFGEVGLSAVKQRLSAEHGSFGDFPNLQIKDGIQALWKKAYHLKNVKFSRGIATGINGLGDVVKVEPSILRGVLYNREFYPFKPIEPDAWCIFPYRGATADAILWSTLRREFPLASAYLGRVRARIKKEVACRKGERWHTFTREHNHALYNAPKIVMPMTARDTIASYDDGEAGLYMDNANVWFVRIDGASEMLMKSIAAIINSTVFSVLAKADANPQRGGYFKFNKQFLNPVPFPSRRLVSDLTMQRKLAALHDELRALEVRWCGENTNHRALTAAVLKRKWMTLDACCGELYGLTETEAAVIEGVGRSVDRTRLLPQ